MEGSWLSYSQGRRPACFTLTVSHSGEPPGDRSKRRPNGAYDKPKEVGQAAHCAIVVADDAWQGRWTAIILPRIMIGDGSRSIERGHTIGGVRHGAGRRPASAETPATGAFV